METQNAPMAFGVLFVASPFVVSFETYIHCSRRALLIPDSLVWVLAAAGSTTRGDC